MYKLTEDSIDIDVWKQLNNGKWPIELAEIKPPKWEESNYNSRSKLVIEYLGLIIYHLDLIKNTPAPKTKLESSSYQYKRMSEIVEQRKI
jgi:hypothetical protein